MTTGAIYGNFKNRDELFIALGHAYWAPVVPQIAPGATFAEAMRALASATLAAADERAPAAIGRLTGLAYTLRSGEMQRDERDISVACRSQRPPRQLVPRTTVMPRPAGSEAHDAPGTDSEVPLRN